MFSYTEVLGGGIQTVIFILNQKVSDRPSQRCIPAAWRKNFHVLELGRFRICYRENFCSTNDDVVGHFL